MFDDAHSLHTLPRATHFVSQPEEDIEYPAVFALSNKGLSMGVLNERVVHANALLNITIWEVGGGA
jgi:hypothetical protein